MSVSVCRVCVYAKDGTQGLVCVRQASSVPTVPTKICHFVKGILALSDFVIFGVLNLIPWKVKDDCQCVCLLIFSGRQRPSNQRESEHREHAVGRHRHRIR